jgi:hypothetical protein
MGSLCRVDSQLTLNQPASDLASATPASVAPGFGLGRVFVSQRGVPLLHLLLGFVFPGVRNAPEFCRFVDLSGLQ